MANRNLERSEKYRNFNHDVVIGSTNGDVCIEDYKNQRNIHTTIIPDVSMVKIINGTFILSKESVEKEDSKNIQPIKPVQVYFRSPTSQDATKINPELIAQYNKIMPVDFVVCDDWTELGLILKNKPHQISIHANVFQLTDLTTIGETVSMLQTQLKLVKLDIPIAIVIERTTPKSVVMQAKRLGLQGIIPYHGDWLHDDIIAGLTALTNRVKHWPKHIIDQLPGAEKPKAKTKKQQIQLTERQQDVAKLISQRGCSNKAIGKLLSISESTVKIHVSAILKAYGVRNRTQLALALDGKF
jgi:DNA-binding NarL/FixJ family response regulator